MEETKKMSVADYVVIGGSVIAAAGAIYGAIQLRGLNKKLSALPVPTEPKKKNADK